MISEWINKRTWLLTWLVIWLVGTEFSFRETVNREKTKLMGIELRTKLVVNE